MEAPQRRRRPAATYGKPVKKRFSDVGFGEIFASASLPQQREDHPRDHRPTPAGAITTAKLAQAQNNQEKENHDASPTNAGGGANLLAGPIHKKVRTMLKGKNKRPVPDSTVTTPPKHHKVFDFPSSDDDDDQPRANTRHPKANDGFDVPSSSGEEETTTVRTEALPQRSSRVLSVASASMGKFAKGFKGVSARDSKPQSDSTLKVLEKQVSTSKNITATAKVTKSISSKPPKVSGVSKPASKPSTTLRAPTTAAPESKQAVSNPRMTSVTVEIKSFSQRSLVTHSKPRQPSPDSGVSSEQPSGQPVRRTQQKPSNVRSHITSISGLPKSPNTKRIKRVVSVSIPVISDEPSCLPSPPPLPLPPKAGRKHPIPHPPSILTHVDELSDKSNQSSAEAKGAKRTLGFSGIFRDEVDELPAPRRRRLIDRLGAGVSGINELMPFLSDSSGDSEGEYSHQLSHSMPQSQNIFNSQLIDTVTEEQPQKSITEPPMNPIYNNGRIGPKITYARQRSFRMEEFDEDALFKTPLVMAQQSSRGQRSICLEEDEELEGDTGSKMMKTIHELREAGVNNRFLDDIEELFGDIEGDSTLGRRRSGYLELATKMRDKTFISKFRANNFNERLFANLSKQTDEIICFSLSYILCCFLLEDSTIQTVSQVRSNGSLPMLVRMLDIERDIYMIARDRKMNMSKAAQSLVQDLRGQIEKLPTFADKKPKIFSPQVLALKVLEESVRKLREAGVDDDVLPAGGLNKLVQILEPFAITRLKSVTKNSETLPLELAISILESYTIGCRTLAASQFSEAELNVVASLLPAVIGMETNATNDILLLILRFGINLTNNRSYICDIFAESSLISTLVDIVHTKFNDLADIGLEMEERLIQLDLLILSLGLLINFAELSDKARRAINRQGAVGTSTGEKTFLDVLLQIFLERQERAAEADSVEASQSNVAFGYLSILLGNLCQNRDIKDKVRLKMPKATLTPLFSSLEEFIAHHRQVDDQYESYCDPNAAFTERLEQVVKRLRE